MLRNLRLGWCGVAILLVLGSAKLALAEGFQVIVHASNPVSSLEKGYVSKLFLGSVSRWDHGGKVSPVDLSGRSGTRARFSDDVHRRSVSAIKSHWQKQVFSGRGVPPTEVRSEAEVVSFVERNPGAIGYVSEGASTRGAKRVRIK